jgi:hypothetical protein
MEDFFKKSITHAEVERTELADEIDRKKRIGLPLAIVRDSQQITLCCNGGNPVCGER